MNAIPTYYAWYPVLEKRKGLASIILTRGSHHRAPVGGREFFEAVLDAAGIRAELIAWGAQTFLSSYFAETGWEESWNAKVLISGGTMSESGSAITGAAILVEPDSEENPPRWLPVRVLADFTRRRDADSCRSELKEHAAKAKASEIYYERYSIRDVGPRHKQLAVDVATRERSQLQEAIDAADHVIETCERHGGRTRAPAREA